jgi:hypothetical protein
MPILNDSGELIVKTNLSPDDEFNLLGLIRYNTSARDFFATLDPNSQMVINLEYVIKSGNPHAKIWLHPKCEWHLFYLMSEHYRNNRPNPISFQECSTAYLYWLALMQYDVKDFTDLKEISVERFSENGSFTMLGSWFVNRIICFQEDLGFTIDLEQFKNYILKLPPIEQWMISIIDAHYDYVDAERFFGKAKQIFPFFAPLARDDEKYTAIVSTSIFNFILDHMHSDPMRLRIAPGIVSEQTLAQWHQNNLHHGAAYARLVKNNLEEKELFFHALDTCPSVKDAIKAYVNKCWNGGSFSENLEKIWNCRLDRVYFLVERALSRGEVDYNAFYSIRQALIDLTKKAEYSGYHWLEYTSTRGERIKELARKSVENQISDLPWRKKLQPEIDNLISSVQEIKIQNHATDVSGQSVFFNGATQVKDNREATDDEKTNEPPPRRSSYSSIGGDVD